ncbi:hypothetical protein RB195_000176 [Necator americanus]|uniref:Uncharacterized protein n=1 Tax=Necator americanus TaxID=51031 RepID=A0ABR1D8I0_NECAM
MNGAHEATDAFAVYTRVFASPSRRFCSVVLLISLHYWLYLSRISFIRGVLHVNVALFSLHTYIHTRYTVTTSLLQRCLYGKDSLCTPLWLFY